jgi:DNA-binding transcriptional regulator YdaS (Cro superfamily)
MDDASSDFQALEKAIAKIGSQAEFARLCRVSATAVWKWVQEKKALPPKHVLAVESATGVSRHDLRPDIYPRDLAPAPDAGATDQPEAA